MREITQYESKDNKVFRTKEDCLKYEEVYDRAKNLERLLPQKPIDSSCNFGNGVGYLQHDLDSVTIVFHSILVEALKYTDHNWIQASIDKGYPNVDPSCAMIIVGEYNDLDPLYKLLYRISCIDEFLREWGQPYFKAHPNEAVVYRLN